MTPKERPAPPVPYIRSSGKRFEGAHMTFGLAALTIVHVLISFVGLFSGFIVAFGLLKGRRLDRWTALFLASTVATSLTGFLFPFHQFLPSHAVGMLSLVVLAVAIYARYARRLVGAWRRTYVVTAVIALFLNVFVLIAQLFQKVPPLKAIAPTQAEPPFVVTQLVVLLLFVAMAAAAAIRFRDSGAPMRAA